MLKHVELLLAGLSEAGHEITVACPPEEKLLQSLKAAQVFRLFPLDIGDGLRPLKDPLTIRRLARFLRSHPFDIIHAHGGKAGLLIRLALTGRRGSSCPVVISCHNEIQPGNVQRRGGQLRCRIERILRGGTAHFIAVSPTIHNELTQLIGCPPEQVTFVPNGIEFQEEKAPLDYKTVRAKWGWPQDSFMIGTAARLTREKGIDVLLAALQQAIRRDHRLRLVIIGDGPFGDELRQAALDMGLGDDVCFLGFYESARTLFPAFDAFVLPSRTEGWPLSIMEAMAVGLPTVASRVGGIPWLVQDGKTGILVEPGNSSELAEALLALASNRLWARRLGQEAMAYARDHFDARVMVAQVDDIYQRILAGK